jgi:hypothetical protein
MRLKNDTDYEQVPVSALHKNDQILIRPATASPSTASSSGQSDVEDR